MPIANDSVRISEDFVRIDSKAYDNKHRVNLGKKVFTIYDSLSEFKVFTIFISSNGDLLLRPQLNVPARERWLVETPEALDKFHKGIQDVIDGNVTRVDDLETFLDSL